MPRGRRRGATVLRLAMPRSGATAVLSSCPSLRNERDEAAARCWGRTAVGRQSTRSPSTPCAAIDGSAAIFASTQWVRASRRWRWPAARESALRGRATGGLLATGLLALRRPLRAGTLWPDGQSVGEFLRHGPGRQAAGFGAARVPRYRAVQAGASLSSFTRRRAWRRMACRNGAAGQSRRPDHHGVQHGADLFRPAVAELRMGETSLPPCSACIGRPGWLLRACGGRPGGQAMRDVPSACRATRAGLDRVRALLSLLTFVAARRAGPGRAQLAAMQLGNSSRKAAMPRAGRPCPCTTCAMAWPARRRAGGSRRIRVRREPVLAQRLRRGPAAAGARRYDGRYATAVFRFAHQSPGPGAERGGTCTDDADAQRRVGAASLSWRRVSQVSQERARAMGQLLETAESPWGRPALSMDWLAAWHDVATADSLFADGGGREVTPVPVLCHIVLTGRCTRGVTLRLRG